MFKIMLPVVFLLTSHTVVWGQGALTPSVVVLRDTEESLAGKMALQDQAVLLNANGQLLNTISGLGITEAVSAQSRVIIDATHERIIIAELLRHQISVFDSDGQRQSEIHVESPGAIALTADALGLVCDTSPNLVTPESRVYDLPSGREERRLPVGGVAFVNDDDGNLSTLR